MAEISRTSLYGKLNQLGYKAMESATVFCKMRGNPYVELSHWLHQVLQLQDSDLHQIIRHFELNASRLASDMTGSLDELPRGATSISDISAHLEEGVKQGWLYGSLMFNASQIRTGHILLGLVKDTTLRRVLTGISDQFSRIKPEQLSDEFAQIVGGSPEEQMTARDGSALSGQAAPGEASGAMAPAEMGQQEALAQFSVNLTERAEQGELDPIVGRDEEIRQVVDILMRRRQNNPILTGEAGVGKTAVVEGFAQRIAAGDVPPTLEGVQLHVLDVGLLQAGASMKGEFENRLKQVIEEVQSSPTPIILFIDEAHTLIGAGGAAGTGDAANLLKPALARGTLRTIAATTWAEYKKHIEKDPALTRRFQVIHVDEPDESRALRMMRQSASMLESHHRVQLLDEGLEAAVRLSHRYIPARQLPDKAVSLLDTACARVAVSQHAVPAAVEDARRRIEALETELSIVDREREVGIDHAARREELESQLAQCRQTLSELESAWQQEQTLVDELLQLRRELRGESGESVDAPVSRLGAEADALARDEGEQAESHEAAGGAGEGSDSGAGSATASESGNGEALSETGLTEPERQARLERLGELQSELSSLQGETPLILPSVDEQAVASVVADWTGIPVGRMVKDEIEAVLHLADTLEQRVIGQRHALEAITRRIQTSRANLDNPTRPIGVFLLAGPSGVGKTETALTLAETLYGGEHNLITINMSEFQEAHTVSTLKGAPPGYVGYGEGGILTEAVRRKPYSVVLLDEVEKAHSDVHEIFFQVFDKGMMEDGEGRMIDFKNTIILLTSNVGSDLIMNMCKDPELMPDADGIAKALREPLLKVFPAALLGRLETIPYYPISDQMLQQIVRLQLGRIENRVRENHRVPFSYDDEVVDLIVSRCHEVESGARMVDSILTHHLLPAISREMLTRLMEGQTVQRVAVSVEDKEFAYAFE